MSQQSLFESQRVVDVDIAAKMQQSFLDYSMSVIVGRALPDVRDGLKPVQRRILYAMEEAGLRPDRQHRKCAAVIGDVMKKYHPHGDASIYDALVRMAQDFVMREPLVDGHGNFGSVDGDAAAAHRYTEARLAEIAMELLDGIDEACVDFIPNYDGFESEPVVLPARFPNLLVNGASGIAVGMATNIPPHNLGEVIDACLELIRKPAATVEDLMRLVPAPDFPTGARILDGDGIRDAYLTGRGAITVEAVATTEMRSGGLPRIVVTEIPYQVNKALLLERIATLVKDRKVDEIRDLRDESSRDGMRIVIELKRGEDPSRVLDKLYRLSDLRTNFNVNFVALRGGQPRTLGLRDALVAYLDHQREVVTRRTRFQREKAAARVHVLEGLITALDHLDEVIALIRDASTADAARAALVTRFGLTEVQATAILDMQLRRLAAMEREKLIQEHRDLLMLIAKLDAILASPEALDGLISEELRAIKTQHGNPRRSRIHRPLAPGEESAEPRPLLDAAPVTVYVTAGGWLKAVPQRPTSAPHSHPRDPVVAVVRASTEDTLLLVDQSGGGYRVALADIPVTTMRQRGVALSALLAEGRIAPAPPLAGAVALSSQAETVLFSSAQGLVKRTDRTEYEGRARTMIAAAVRDRDRLVGVIACRDGDHILMAHDGGQAVRFPAAQVRLMGRNAAGVAGIAVPDGGQVIAVTVVPDGVDVDREVVTLCRDGRAMRAPLAEFPLQSRGGKGVKCGPGPIAWCGLAADLHVQEGEHTSVLRPVAAPATRRAGKPSAVSGQVEGAPAAEQGAQLPGGPSYGRD
ncbi:MAG: DNA gyrase/topoisomerase IV subunit A [Egibacteraceae bacterium]